MMTFIVLAGDSTAFIFFPLNWVLQGYHARLLRLLGAGHHPWLGLKAYQFTYTVPEAAALHQLLLRHPKHFDTIVGHSKGNFAIAAALYALQFSLDQENNASVLEDTFGLSDATTVGQTANPRPGTGRNGIDIFTFGCFVSLPHAYGQAQTHAYPSHQYVGDADLVLGFWGSGPLKIWSMWLKGKAISNTSTPAAIADERIVAQSHPFPFPFLTGHNVVTNNPFYIGFYGHMPVEDILKQYRALKP